MTDLQKIYGYIIQDSINASGLEAIAVANNKIIANHISSNEGFAKADLGFEHASPSEHHNKRRHELFAKLFPNGYELIWVGEKTWQELTSEILIKN